MCDRQEAARNVRDVAETAANYSASVDVTDPVQTEARAALGDLVNWLLSNLDRVPFDSMPSPAARVTLQYLHQSIELMSDSWWLLQPDQNIFARSHLVSHVLRSWAGMHARSLSVWSSADPELMIRGVLSDSMRQEILGMEAAASAGADVEEPTDRLKRMKAGLGDHIRVNTANTLEEHGECEVLAVYRWESGHIHVGTAELMARGRSGSVGHTVVDMALHPASLWRVGQLTWASYGLGLRVITMMAQSIGVPIGPLITLDSRLRLVVQRAAVRLPDIDEPPSPPYGSFAFPIWAKA